MTTKITTTVKPLEAIDKINEIIDNTADKNLSNITETAKAAIRQVNKCVDGDSIYQKDVHCTDTAIVLQDGVSSYDITITANSTISFDPSQLSEPISMKTFEVLLAMPTVCSIAFAGVTWIDNNAPDMSETCSYLFAFRTYAGWDHWIGNLQGKVY